MRPADQPIHFMHVTHIRTINPLDLRAFFDVLGTAVNASDRYRRDALCFSGVQG
jgi:hypothetical protein